MLLNSGKWSQDVPGLFRNTPSRKAPDLDLMSPFIFSRAHQDLKPASKTKKPGSAVEVGGCEEFTFQPNLLKLDQLKPYGLGAMIVLEPIDHGILLLVHLLCGVTSLT
jgi:hypothetical protein